MRLFFSFLDPSQPNLFGSELCEKQVFKCLFVYLELYFPQNTWVDFWGVDIPQNTWVEGKKCYEFVKI